ncbi:MAG: septum formation initiator family protein [Clostridiales bacterium]|nr:septum formation initiator family protein [Clostridiales bacterium]
MAARRAAAPARTGASGNRQTAAYAAGGRRQGNIRYIEGAAAPKLAPVPERPAPQRKKKPSSGTSVRASHQIRRNQERAMYMDLPYIILLTIASVCTLYLCITYLHVQSSITARMHNIELQEAKLERLKAENDALETNINTSIDLNEIYEIATKELGMVYAKKDQVLLYDKTESEYVRQYEDIPEH